MTNKQEISGFLEKYAFASECQSPISSFTSVLKCKAVKIWTSICKKTFSEIQSQFLEKLICLLRMPPSIASEAELQRLSLSLSLFKAAFEELVRPDYEVGSNKTAENVFILGRSAPQLFAALANVVETLLGHDLIDAARAMFSTASEGVSEAQMYTCLRHVLCLNTNILFSSTDVENKRLSVILLKNFTGFLESLNVVLSVASGSLTDHCRLYSLLYIFVLMGFPKLITAIIEASRQRNLSPAVSVDSLAEIGMHSLSCLTELVERKDFPRDVLIQHLFHVYRIIYWVMLMLDTEYPLPGLASSVINLLAESGVMLSTAGLESNLADLAAVTQSVESTSEDFYQKLADILRLLVTNFLFSKTVDDNSTTDQNPYIFSPTKFLQRVQYFTFSVCRPLLSVYLSSLDLWIAYLDFIKAIHYGDSVLSTGTHKPVELPQQTQLIISDLCSSLLSTIYFSESSSYLDVLDNEAPPAHQSGSATDFSNSYVAFFEDTLQLADSSDLMADQSEYGIFIQTSLTLLSSIAFFNPTNVLHSVAAKFQKELAVFSQLCNLGDKVTLEEHTTRKLHSALRDLATCLSCLTYLSEHFGSLQDTSMLRWLLQALVFNLGSGVSLCDRLESLRMDTIRQDVVQVVVENINLLRCLMSSGLVIVCEDSNVEIPRGHVVLTLEDKDAFSTALIQCIHHLLLKSPVVSLRLHTTQLFQALVLSANPPGFLPPAGLLSEGGCLLELVNCCCETARLKSFSIPVQRLLVRSVTAYLLVDEVPPPSQSKFALKCLEQLQALTSEKGSILANRLIPFFSQALRQETLTTDRDAYFASLCWLNEALASLMPLGSKSRRLMYDSLTASGLLDRIWQCLDTTSLSPEVHLFVAHLSFFVQFTDIYGSQRTTASLIPGFVAKVMRLLHVLESNTAPARLVSPIVSHLVHLINRLVQNRTVFPPMAPDVLRFVSNCLVVNLAGGIMADLPTIVSTASRNDPDLCLRVFDTLFQTMSFGYSQLTSEENLATFLRSVLAVYSGGVFDPRLITACTEALCDLNMRHRLFALPSFLANWRGQFARRFLNLLVGGGAVQQGSDTEMVLVKALHAFYCSPEGLAVQEFWDMAVHPFLVEAVALPTDKVELLAKSALTFAQNGVATANLKNLEDFSATFNALLSDVKQWLRANPNAHPNTIPVASLANTKSA
uniref:DUF1741 domain-containing protein n=1 Tax=Mesocestoides corti TaxID=53468 RepID=A0A5K3FSZ8_MESCO